MKITLKTEHDLEKMRIAGRLAAEVLQIVAPHVKPGATTAELDRICHEHIVQVQGAIPANVGYKGFPASICKARFESGSISSHIRAASVARS